MVNFYYIPISTSGKYDILKAGYLFSAPKLTWVLENIAASGPPPRKIKRRDALWVQVSNNKPINFAFLDFERQPKRTRHMGFLNFHRNAKYYHISATTMTNAKLFDRKGWPNIKCTPNPVLSTCMWLFCVILLPCRRIPQNFRLLFSVSI